jgi:geranylgeranyl pyrophosphate synthase
MSAFEVGNTAPVPFETDPDAFASRTGSKEGVDHCLPRNGDLAELLGICDTTPVEDVLQATLLHPLAELTTNPGKRIRAQLVAFSDRLLSGEMPPSVLASKRCRLAAEAIELIHAGSLIVDDIEDGSQMRRGRMALHLRYAMPVALNAGNWLYFWPFELFREMALPKDRLLLIYESCHRTLLRAHFGQALDVGAKINTLAQRQVTEVCIASMRLKTGALMGFATLLGGALADASERLLSVLDDFGRDLGIALQMFDDLGNVIGKCEPSKRYEDLILSRPSWVWACAAKNSAAADYQAFLAAIRRLPDAEDFEAWMAEHDIIHHTRQSARIYLDQSFDTLEKRLSAAGAYFSCRAFDELRDLGEEIAVAYG